MQNTTANLTSDKSIGYILSEIPVRSADAFRFAYTSHALHHEHALRLIAAFRAEMLNLILILAAEIVKSQTVQFIIHNGAQLLLQHTALSRVNQAFKHGILHTLSIIDALPGNLPQRLRPAAVSVLTS